MKKLILAISLLAVFGFVSFSAPVVNAQAPTVAELQAQIRQLQAKIELLMQIQQLRAQIEALQRGVTPPVARPPVAADSVTVISPNGGEIFRQDQGMPFSVRVGSQREGVFTNVALVDRTTNRFFHIISGHAFNPRVSPVFIGDLSLIGKGITPGNNFVLNVGWQNAGETTVTFDSSDAPFSIVAPPPTPVPATPVITSVSPTSDSAGAWVTIHGRNLANRPRVEFIQGVSVRGSINNPVVQADGSLRFLLDGLFVANVGAGTYQLQVLTDTGTSNRVNFTVTAPAVTPSPTPVPATPVITSVSPTSGSAGAWVTIHGRNLVNAPIVEFIQGVSLRGVVRNPTAQADGSLRFQLNEAIATVIANPGTYQVQVVTGAGTSNRVNFTVTGTIAPAAQLARQHLADRLRVPASDILFVRVESVRWPDSSLGCPLSGHFYSQVITPGFIVVMRHLGRDYIYHTGSLTGDPHRVVDCTDNPLRRSVGI